MKLIGMLLLLCGIAFANNPGGHMVQLSWNEADPTATFNVYRGTSSPVCSVGKVPYATNVVTLAFEDDNVLPGTTYIYAVTATPKIGGESACSAEAQAAVSNSMGQSVTNLQIKAQ